MIIKYEGNTIARLYAKEGDEFPVGWMQPTFNGIWAACPDHGFYGYFPTKIAALLAADAALQ